MMDMDTCAQMKPFYCDYDYGVDLQVHVNHYQSPLGNEWLINLSFCVGNESYLT